MTEEESRVLEMYDDIARVFADETQSCEALGEALSSSAKVHAADLAKWSRQQKELTAEQAAASQERLLKLAGHRMQRAQDLIRRSMDKCLENEAFQIGLRSLAAFGAHG